MVPAGGRLTGPTGPATTATRTGRFGAGELATLGAVAEEWLAALLAVGPTDREAAEAGVGQAYQVAGLAPPERVVWLGSPLAGAVAVALLTGLDAAVAGPDPVWERVREELERQGQPAARAPGRPIGRPGQAQARAPGRPAGRSRPAPGRGGRPVRPRVGPRCWGQVRAQMLDQVGPGLWEQAWNAAAGVLPGRLPERLWRLQLVDGGHPIDSRLGWPASERLWHEAMSGIPEVVWCALVDGLGRVLPDLAGPERLAGLGRVTRAAGWWWPLDRVAVLTDRPLALHRDEQGRLHRPDGPALAYSDGSALHARHGMLVEAELIDRLPRLRADDITAEPDLELRRVMTEWYGQGRYLRDAGGRLVGEDAYGRLWRLDRPEGEPLVMVEVVNATPGPDGSAATYWLRVPPDIRSAHAAVAWTFGLNEGNYRPLAES